MCSFKIYGKWSVQAYIYMCVLQSRWCATKWCDFGGFDALKLFCNFKLVVDNAFLVTVYPPINTVVLLNLVISNKITLMKQLSTTGKEDETCICMQAHNKKTVCNM